MEPLSVCLFASLGIIAGTLAGLLGIGGGMLIVPGLFYLFRVMQLPEEALMHLAAGTSMCIMIGTAIASTWAHQTKGHIQWSLFRSIAVWIGSGVILGNVLANHLPTQLLELVFGVFLLAIALKILFATHPKLESGTIVHPSLAITGTVGMVIGFKSGVLGIGGGALSVPFLLYCGLPMNRASGTSAAFTLPIAITGTLSFMLLSGEHLPIPWSTGYIYWPAVALVMPLTMLGAPIGAQLSRIVPADKLRNVFAGLLLFISIKMLASAGFVDLNPILAKLR